MYSIPFGFRKDTNENAAPEAHRNPDVSLIIDKNFKLLSLIFIFLNERILLIKKYIDNSISGNIIKTISFILLIFPIINKVLAIYNV